MNDRDHFAAAALAGLLAAPTDKDRSMDYWARLSYEAADAMLRGRERVAASPVPYVESDEKRCFFNTNHDAAPAAKARTDAATGEPGGDEGTGDTREPAWCGASWSGACPERERTATNRISTPELS